MIACYARVSTTEQAVNGHSIDEQNERMQKYCDAMGWKPCKLYTDGGFSGANTERPALQNLIKDVKAHKVERVLVYKLDRLSRSQRDTLTLIEDLFLKNGCEFVSMNENFDTATPFGRAMIGILAVFAQLEREQIKERMIMGQEARAKQGKYHGSDRTPVGYDYVNGELIINDYEAEQIRQAFELFVGGMSIPKIVKTFNEAGIEHKYGKWQQSVLRHILSRKTYIGYIYHKGIWYKGNHEPILTDEVFNAAQNIIDRTHAETIKYNRRYGKASSYLGSLLFCAECGNRYAKLSTSRNGVKWEYYTCNTRRSKALAKGRICSNSSWKLDELESLVFGEIKKLVFEDVKPTTDNRPKMLSKSLSEVEQKISRLIDLYASGTLSRGDLESKIKALNEKREKISNELDRLIKERQDQLTQDDIIGYAKSFDKVLKRANYDEIRAVLTALIDHIEVSRDDITIYWNF